MTEAEPRSGAGDEAGSGSGGDAGAEVEVDWSALRDLLRDEPRSRSAAAPRSFTLVAAALWLVSLLLVGVTWNGVAERTDVALQVPILVSGGFSAVVLAVVGAAVFVAGHLRGR